MENTTYIATSFHLYSYHEKRGEKIVDNFRGVTSYDFGLIPPPFQTPFELLDDVLKAWFALEKDLRNNPKININAVRDLGDPFLSLALEMMRIYQGVKVGWPFEKLAEELAKLPGYDLTAAAYEFFGRQYPSVLIDIPELQIARFIEAYKGKEKRVFLSSEEISAIIDSIKRLHTKKDAAYGISWKKRGELTSILANIARKVDRLEQYSSKVTELIDESVLDTAIDLFVYLLKYRLFLFERGSTQVATLEFPNWQPPYSEDLSAFNESADKYLNNDTSTRHSITVISDIILLFEQLHNLALDRIASVEERLGIASDIEELAFELILALAKEYPNLLLTLKKAYGPTS